MRECKVIRIAPAKSWANEWRYLERNDSCVVVDIPSVEKEINRYLAQGYRIVSSYSGYGMWFVLEREK